ncbi:MAG: hypothetical protein IJY42_06810 [Clostridia bacterium]|nr:hypothetical protein [Clostridia bacterium]
MKKIALITLSILSLLCCCMMLSGCELLFEYGILCRHEYTITETPATCTSPKIQVNTCVNCGKSYQHEVGQ